jgi:putative spermidine/putrescine transport system permease protein
MDQHIPHRHRLWLYLLSALILGFLILPTLIVIPMSFSASDALQFPPRGFSWRWYEAYFSTPQWLDATLVSLKISLLTMLLATPIGTAAAYGLHFGRFRFALAVQGSLVAALMVPVILIAIGVFFLYAKLGLINTTLGLVLADTLLAVPFVLIIVTAGLTSFDANQEMVARSLGAGRLRAFLGVTLPQIWRSVLAGALFAFIAAFDEVVIATMISGGEGATLTNRMFSSLRDEVDPTIAAISTLLIAITTLPPLIGHLLSTRRAKT